MLLFTSIIQGHIVHKQLTTSVEHNRLPFFEHRCI